MNIENYRIKSYLFIFFLLSISVMGLFLTSWNRYIKNSESFILPIIFLVISLLIIIYLFYLFHFPFNEDVRDNDQQSENTGERNKKGISEKKEVHYIMPEDIAKRILSISGGSPLTSKTHALLKNLASEFDIMQAVLYLYNTGNSVYEMSAGYALNPENPPQPFRVGEGIHGQVILNKQIHKLSHLPETYRIVSSGLGTTYARFLYLLPVVKNDESIALIEFSTLKDLGDTGISILNIISRELGEGLSHLITGKDEN